MRICYLADAESIHTVRWLQFFAGRGHDVHLLSKQPWETPIESVRLHLLRRLSDSPALAPLNLMLATAQVRRLLAHIRPDILHSHYLLDYGSYGALSGFHPLVATAWGTDVLVDPQKSKVWRALTRVALQRADLITCDGENSRRAMIDLGIDGEKIRHISHGIDTALFSPLQRDEALCRKLGLTGSTVISLRSHKPIYDMPTLIEAMPLIAKEVPEVRFIVAGDGPQRQSLMALAKELGVWDCAVFTGNLAHSDLPRYLASSDVYVSTSLSDGGIALSTLEAMSCGLAAVVTDVGDAHMWIRPGEGGFLVPVGTPAALAEKVIYLLRNKDVLKKFGVINRSIVKDNADYHREMSKMERLYEDLVKRYQR